MLNLLVAVPFCTILLLLSLEKSRHHRIISLISSAIQMVMAGGLIYVYSKVNFLGQGTLYIQESSYRWFPGLNIFYHTGVDGIALAMLLLTSIVVFTGVLVSWRLKQDTKEFFILLFLLAIGANGFFISLDLFSMFFYLEMAVIPKFLLIAKWGSGKRDYSAMKLTLMLTTGSALLLTGILGLYYYSGMSDGFYTFDYFQLLQNPIPIEGQRIIFPLMFTGFGVFTAMFPFHSWAPDGHSSAPTAASMFLAGISMKLGGYGCLKYAVFLMPQAASEQGWIFISLAVIGVVYGSFVTLRQTDIKYINAYSSISHCGLVLLGILMMTRASMTGAVLQMFSHGIMTALFFAVIGMIYARTHTREISQMSGLLKPLPFLGAMFTIAGLCSLGLPGLSGFVAEANIFFGSFEREQLFYRIATIVTITSIVVTAVYILRTIGRFLMGPLESETFARLRDAAWHEKLSAGVLVLVILAVGTMPFWLTNLLNDGFYSVMDFTSHTSAHGFQTLLK